MIPRIYNHSYTITADLVIPEGGAEGVIVAEADHLGGFSLFVQDGKLKHTYSMMGVLESTGRSPTEPLPDREVSVRMEFAADAPEAGDGRRGDAVRRTASRSAGGRMEHTVPVRFSGYAGMDIGRDNGGVVDRSYADKAPFAFTGTIKKVVFDIEAAHAARRTRAGAPRARPAVARRPRDHMPREEEHERQPEGRPDRGLPHRGSRAEGLRRVRRARGGRRRSPSRESSSCRRTRGRGGRHRDRRPPRPQGREARAAASGSWSASSPHRSSRQLPSERSRVA